MAVLTSRPSLCMGPSKLPRSLSAPEDLLIKYSIAHDSIETVSHEQQLQHRFKNTESNKSDPNQDLPAQTPDWYYPPADSHAHYATPTLHSNPWNVGIPGSDAEHEIMDMRATAPFEGWDHEPRVSETPDRDGTPVDNLDWLMDRRSCFSPTPVAVKPAIQIGTIEEENSMEE